MTEEQTIAHLIWWACIADIKREAAERAAQDAEQAAEEEDAAA